NIQIPENTSVIARCKLDDKPDNISVSLITPFWIYFITRKKTWRFEHENVQQISTGHHKLMGPLIGGCLLSCFSIILLSRNIFDPFLLLTFFVIGLITTYYGWQGADTIMVREKNDATNIYLTQYPDGLDSYLKFYRDYIRKPNHAMSIYHIATAKEWKEKETEYRHISLNSENFIHASTKEQVLPTFQKHFPAEGDFLLLEIDMQQLTSEVKFEYVSDREELFPHIYGTINKSAVISVLPFQNPNELKQIMFNL
ncbi:MAG: DUF952 domain-containing protein, partial [Cyclobacteriaceae bacterium]